MGVAVMAARCATRIGTAAAQLTKVGAKHLVQLLHDLNHAVPIWVVDVDISVQEKMCASRCDDAPVAVFKRPNPYRVMSVVASGPPSDPEIQDAINRVCLSQGCDDWQLIGNRLVLTPDQCEQLKSMELSPIPQFKQDLRLLELEVGGGAYVPITVLQQGELFNVGEGWVAYNDDNMIVVRQRDR